MKYYSTFITGFQDVVRKQLAVDVPDISVEYITDGLVVYESSAPIEKISKIGYVNNSFILLTMKKIPPSPSSADKILQELIRGTVVGTILRKHFNKKKTIRIRGSYANQHIRLKKPYVRELEKVMLTSAPNLRIDRSLPDIELVLGIRTEGVGLAGIQFTRRPNYEKTLHKGELYPEMAHILCMISEPSASDVFIDPFAGYGSIPAARSAYPYKHIIVGDSNKRMVSHLRARFRKGRDINVKRLNGLHLDEIGDNAIDAVVTDPPWGVYQKDTLDVPVFYQRMFSELARIVRPGGTLVLVSAQKEIVLDLVHKERALTLKKEYSTLVSGKKAGVYTFVVNK